MKKKTESRIILVLLFIGMLTLAFNIQLVKAGPKTIYVDDDNTAGPWDGTPEHPYQNITSGIEHASTDDEVFVYSGTYHEYVTINKSLKLIGADRESTVIQNTGGDFLVHVTANNVVLTDFTIYGDWKWYDQPSFGIWVDNSENTVINNNDITKFGVWGVLVNNSQNCTVIKNTVTSNGEKFWGGRLEDHGGIKIGNSSNCRVVQNTAEFNIATGIAITESTSCEVFGNTAIDNFESQISPSPGGYNVFVRSSENCTVVENVVEKDRGFGPINGILIVNSENCEIIGNIAERNAVGIFLDNSRNCTLQDNDMDSNGENFAVSSENLLSYMHKIDTSNRVNGRPVYYWINRHDETVPLNAGYVALINSTNITVENLTLQDNRHGVLVAYTSNSIMRNLTLGAKYGVYLDHSYDCITEGIHEWTPRTLHSIAILLKSSNQCYVLESSLNLPWGYTPWVTKNIKQRAGWPPSSIYKGVRLEDSNNNAIFLNTINSSDWSRHYGIELHQSSDNTIFHNNIYAPVETDESINIFDNGYPYGGNYWVDYNGTDLYSGPYQNETGSDGIGDTPYAIDDYNHDDYPLIDPYIPLEEMRVLYYDLLEKYNELVSSFDSLNATYYELLTDYESLNSTYYELLTKYDSLNSSYNNLQTSYNLLNSTYNTLNVTYNALLSDYNNLLTHYNNLLGDYNSLSANYTSLNSTYSDLLNTYNELHSDYNALQTAYNSLNSTYNSLRSNYDSLQANYADLKSKYDALTNDLGTTRNLNYVFIVTTIVFIATTVYLAMRKPKMKPESKTF